MKNVLMIVYTDYKYDARVRREAETLVKNGDCKVSVITLKDNRKPTTYHMGGVKVVEVNQKKYEGQAKFRYILSYFHFLIRSAMLCTYIYFTRKIDVIHVHNMPDFLIFAAVIPKLFGCKLVLDIHDSMPETYLAKFNNKESILFKMLRLEESMSIAVANKIICVNQMQKDVIVSRGLEKEKAIISLNVPAPDLFPVNKKPLSDIEDRDAFRMVYHGTIAHRLGIDLIVQALALLDKTIPNIEFHLWGKPEKDLRDIEALAASLKVASRLKTIHDGLPLEEVAMGLKIMDIGVIANRKGVATELMLPVKLLEYVTVGIPVVAPRLRCIQHYFSEEMISFYEPENIESLAQAITSLHQDKDKRRKQAYAAQGFLNEYGWETHQNDLIEMYQNL